METPFILKGNKRTLYYTRRKITKRIPVSIVKLFYTSIPIMFTDFYLFESNKNNCEFADNLFELCIINKIDTEINKENIKSKNTKINHFYILEYFDQNNIINNSFFCNIIKKGIRYIPDDIKLEGVFKIYYDESMTELFLDKLK